MAVRHRIWNARMADKVFKVFIAVNVLCQFCPCRTSVDIRGQAFIQTDNELRYVIDSGPSALHLSSGQSIYDQSLSSVVRFDPPSLDFNEQPVGMPHTERVMVLNMDRQSSLHLLSISGSTSHFHCSFFQDKLVPPLGNTTFEVVFLARQVGSIENTLYIHSSKGSFKYQVSGIGIHNPYRIRSFLGAKVPVNSSFSPVIHMYNPHGSVLQVEEIYTSGGDLHLELPTGEREASRELWEIPPFETKMIMRASFVGRVENNHTAFIRIRTNKDDKQQMLIVPVEVEVTSEQGIFSLLELLDFGLLRSIDDPFQLRLNVINSGSTSIQIANVTVQPPNPAVHIDFRPIQLKPDIFNPTSIAVISFAASEVTSLKQCSGKIVVRSKNSDHKLSIPYQATVLHGSLVYDRNQTLFYSGGLTSEAQQNVTREIRVTNTFNITVVVYNIVLSPTSRQMFTISNFTRPCSVSPQQTAFLFSLKFHPNTTMLQFTTDVYLHTNTSIFKIPIYVYHGRLKVIHHRPEIFKGQLDFGTLAMGEKHVMNFTLRNDNPVDVNIDKFSANMEGAVVHLLGVERGNATTLSGPSEDTTLETTELVLKPFHMAVFGVTITAPNREGTFSAEVIINTQFEFLYIPMTLRTAEGGLSLSATGPDKLLWNKCFPGRVSPSELRVHSSFGHPLEVRTISFSPNDTRFYYVPIKEKPIVMAGNQDTLIGHVYFDPRRDCRDDCYVSLPTHIPAGHTWLLGSTLDHEVTDTDQYLFTRYRQKWDDLCAAQMSTVNVTVQLDSNKVRGFLFPAQAQLYWPSMTRRARIKFPLTQIGNVSLSEFVLENPADVPVVVQVLPLNVYPNVQTLLDTITPSLIPHEIGSDLVVSGEDDPDSDVFTLPDLTEQSGLQPMPPGDTTSLNALRRAVETTLGVRPHRRTFSMLVPPRVKLTVRSKFQPKDDGLKTSLIIIRNNLTIIDAVVVQGQGGYGELKFSNRKPGSQKPLTFEMTEKQLKNCDKRAYSSTRNIPPSFTMKRTFTARNTGQLPIYINAMNIGNSDCEGYGFKVLDCNSFELLPNDSRKVDIMFTPDFTMSRIRQTLTLHTSLSTIPLNFTLQATIPAHMLSLCASTLPRPSWEPLLYYAAVLAMGFLLFCVVVASYFEADRISVTDSIRRRAEMTQAAAAYEKGRVFDLRTITSGLRQPVVAGDVTDKMKNGSTYAAITPSGIVKSRLSVGELSSNGYAVSSGKFASSDGAPKSISIPSEGLVRRFLSRHLSSTSPETASTCPDTAGKDVKPRVGVESVSCAGNGNRGKVSNLVRNLVWLLSIPVGVATQLKSIACRVWMMPKKLRRLSVPTKDSGTPNSSCGTCLEGLVNLPNGGNDLDSSAAVTKSDTRSATVQGRKSEKSSAAGSPLSPGEDFVSFRGPGSSRNSRPKKSGKSTDFHRVKEKLADAEKLAASSLFDKDDSSSTTTETSSIEADDKILGLNVSDLGDQHLSSKGKRPANSKYRHDMAKIPITEPSPLAVAPSFTAPTLDQFIPATNKMKGTKKAKLDTNSLKTTPIELPYTIKRAGSDSGPTVVKDVQRPKQAVSPPLSSSASTSSTNGSTQRRKASKSKSTDGTVGSVDVATQRDRNASYCVWEMPTPGGRHVADLSDLSAQTDAFARSHRPQSASPKETLSPASGLMRSSATPPLSTPPVPSRSSSYSSVVSCASIGRAKSPDLVPSGMKYESDTTMTSPSDVDISPIGRHSPGLNPIGSTSIRPSVASRPVAAVGAVRRSWLPRDANAQSLSSIGDEIMMMGGPPALYCRPANNSSYANHSNPMLSAGVGDGLLISPASTFSPPPLNLDPVMAGFVSANPNTMINMMPSNDGIVDQCGSEYGAVGASKVPSHVSDHQATMMQVLQADRRRRYLEYQQRKKLERNSREWPGFEQPAISKCFDDSIWERSSPSPPQAWPEFVPMGSNQQSLAPKGPTLQQQPMPAGLWGRNPPSAGWNAAGSFEFWGSEASAGTGNTTDYHGVEDGSSVFDPFNSLDMNRIWNPNSSDTSSSVSGWSLGMAVQRPDNN